MNEKEFTPLENDQIQQIAKIMYDVWDIPPAKKAAIALLKLDCSSEQFWRFCKSASAQQMPTAWTNNTYNELRNLEAE